MSTVSTVAPVGNAAYAIVSGADVDAWVLMIAAFFSGIIMFIISLIWVGGVCTFRFCCGCCGGRRRKRDTYNYTQRSKFAWRIVDMLIALGLLAGGMAGLAGMAAMRQDLPAFLNGLKQFSTNAAAVGPVVRNADATNEALVQLRQKGIELSGTLGGMLPNTDDWKNNEFYNYAILAITIIAAAFFVTSIIAAIFGFLVLIVPKPWLARGMVVTCMIFLAWHFLLFAFMAPVNTIGTTVCKMPDWFQNSENMKKTFLARQINACEAAGKWMPVYFKPGDNQPRMTPDEVTTYLGGAEFNKGGRNLTNFYIGVDTSVRGELDIFYQIALDNAAGIKDFQDKLKSYLSKQPGRLGQIGKDLDFSSFSDKVDEFAKNVKKYGNDFTGTCTSGTVATQQATGTATPAVRLIDWKAVEVIGGKATTDSSKVYNFEDTIAQLKCSDAPTMVIDLFVEKHVTDIWGFRVQNAQDELRRAEVAGQPATKKLDLQRQLADALSFMAMMEMFEAHKFAAATRLVGFMFGEQGSLSCGQLKTIWTGAIKGALCGRAVLGGVRVLWASYLVCGIFGFLAVTLGLMSINRFVASNLATVVPSFAEADEEADGIKPPVFYPTADGQFVPEPGLPPPTAKPDDFPPLGGTAWGAAGSGSFGATEPALPAGQEPALPRGDTAV